MPHLHRFSCQLAATLLLASVVLLLPGCVSPDRSGELTVKTNFPGGSAMVQDIDHVSRTIRLEPTHYPDRGWDAWWYFKLEGIQPGETITLDVGKGIWATPDRAVFSLDNKTWRQTEPGERKGDRIVFKHIAEARTIWFAWGPPFLLRDAKELVRTATRQNPFAKAITLTQSREGRAVPALRIEDPGVSREQRLGIWIQARQHAWESGSSWVAAGLVNWLVSDDPRAATLRRKSRITIVPIMDLDNVERGAGGKNQVPHDHNRDWNDSPHWPGVRAAIGEITEMDENNRFHLFLDLHNPGPNAREPFFFILPDEFFAPPVLKRHRAFMDAVKVEMTGPLRFTGRTQKSGPKYDPRWNHISSNWVRSNTRGHVVSLCLETPWNAPGSTVDGYQQVGRELGQAIERFFRRPPVEVP